MEFLGVINKQPSEVFAVKVLFAEVLEGNETVSTHSVSATDEDGNSVTSTLINTSSLSGSTVTLVLQAGTDGKKYSVTVSVTTDSSPAAIHEREIKVVVNEVDYNDL